MIRTPLVALTAFALVGFCIASAHAADAPTAAKKGEKLGKVERKDPALDKLIAPGTEMEKLAEGLDWSEGPVWVKNGGYLLFSDTPTNTVYKLEIGKAPVAFIHPSGYAGTDAYSKEPGSNGLLVDRQGNLVLCQHGNRRIARLPQKEWGKKNAKFEVVADKVDGKRFNSPNDITQKSNGDFYFTDPPYGLPKLQDDPSRETKGFGVYRVDSKGKVTLLTDKLTRPNGIAFSPDEKTLYVANSDPAKAVWMAFPVKADGTLGEGKVFFDSTPWVKEGKKGLPDGMKIDQHGNLFAAGPGGVHIFSPQGKLLGTLATGEATGNCGWGGDGSTLYICADMYIARIQTKTKGNGWK